MIAQVYSEYSAEMQESGEPSTVCDESEEWSLNGFVIRFAIQDVHFFSIGSKTKFPMLLIPTLVSVCITETGINPN